jgi:predicted nucleic acid-binding protein
MSQFVLFDMSVLVDELRTNRNLDRVSTTDGPIRNSSVVLAELWRGVSLPVDRKAVEELEKNHPTFTPPANNWVESGQILAKMRADLGFEPRKLRDLHFDVLIALTARTHGARLITSNRADFELICEYLEFQLEVW